MEPSRAGFDPLAPSTSSRKGHLGMFRKIRKRLFEPDNRAGEGFLSCFQFSGQRSATGSIEVEESELANPLEEQCDVEICEKCRNVFLSSDGEESLWCPTCYKDLEESDLSSEDVKETEAMFDASDEDSDEVALKNTASGKRTPIKINEENLKAPIQCITCKKIVHTKLIEYLTDEQIFNYECLDCELKHSIRSKKSWPPFAKIEPSVLDKEVNKMKGIAWEKCCERRSSLHSFYPERPWKCGAPKCPGMTGYRVECKDCGRTFHNRCADLPAYFFKLFRCQGCKMQEVEVEAAANGPAGQSVQVITCPKANQPPPIFCCDCKNRIIFNCDHYLYNGSAYRFRCLKCVHQRDFMV